MPDGGFVVAYEDTSWGNGKDITARIYNAAGGARTDWLHVNAAANGGNQAGNQGDPTIAVLPSGVFIVGWSDGNSFRLQAYDARPELDQITCDGIAGEDEVAHVGGGMFAYLAERGFGRHRRFDPHAVRVYRMIKGDATSETIVGSTTRCGRSFRRRRQ